MKPTEQIAREAADGLILWAHKNQIALLKHKPTIEQIILAAIREAMRVEWADEPPTEVGLWQHRFCEESLRVGRNVVMCEGVPCCEFGGEFLTVDSIGGQWSNKPIKEPE
jgi:hypothetical protein